MDVIETILTKDPRYDAEAYYFVREALDFTAKMLKKPAKGKRRHLCAAELLEGIRSYALQELGPMTLTVFDHWGIRQTRDFGEIVFNLVECGALGKTEEDKKEDFDNGYDFQETFSQPFLPKSLHNSSAANKTSDIRK